jgi:hypothetical protein
MAGIIRSIVRAGGSRLALKAAKSAPIVGTVLVIGLVGYEIKKKGLIRGIVNTALDATPVVGVAKNAIEVFTGDWLADKSESNALISSQNRQTQTAAALPATITARQNPAVRGRVPSSESD